MDTKKAALIFPGIGYHVDRPLLYFGKKLASARGYEIIDVPYGHFEHGIRGNEKKMWEAFESALRQASISPVIRILTANYKSPIIKNKTTDIQMKIV